MKKLTLSITSILFVCVVASFTSFKPELNVTSSAKSTKYTIPVQTRVQPFCKFDYVDHEGRNRRIKTGIVHATTTQLLFIFDSGERLVFSFAKPIHSGHFVAEGSRSRDVNVLFYTSHDSPAIQMNGAISVLSAKPINGVFNHLISNNGDHLMIMSGSFSL